MRIQVASDMAASVRTSSSFSGSLLKTVGAIDFGTCNTRIAFGMRPVASAKQTGTFRVQLMTEWEESKGNPDMAPTSILFNKAKEVVAYGFAAENMFKHLGDGGDEHYFFRNFKMDLHGRETFSPDQPLRASNKGTMPAIQVFSAALRYLSRKLVKFIKNTVENSGVENVEDILWVLTVPAIWKPGARHFMRKAAFEAGLCRLSAGEHDHLVIALEPECAALYVWNQREEHHDPESRSVNYAVVDCGGGTVDIAYHSVIPAPKEEMMVVKELAPPSGGPFGGTLVDNEFEMVLDKVFGCSFVKALREHYADVWMGFMSDLERGKTGLHAKKDDEKVYFDLSMQFADACQEITGQSARSLLKDCKVPGVKFANLKLQIDVRTVKEWYRDSVTKTCSCINNDLKGIREKVTALHMVGTFSKSRYLLDEVRTGVKGIKEDDIFNPEESHVAIVKGAVLYGFNPSIVQERVAALSYGIGYSTDFDPSKHPDSKKQIIDGKEICNGLYREFIAVGTRITTDTVYERSVKPGKKDSKRTTVNIFCAPHNVMFLDDPGCRKLASIHVELGDSGTRPDRRINVIMKLGGTELYVIATDEVTGESFDASIDFEFQ